MVCDYAHNICVLVHNMKHAHRSKFTGNTKGIFTGKVHDLKLHTVFIILHREVAKENNEVKSYYTQGCYVVLLKPIHTGANVIIAVTLKEHSRDLTYF